LDTHPLFDIYNYEEILNLADKVLEHLSNPKNNVKTYKNLAHEENEKIVRNFLTEFAKQIKSHTLASQIQLSNTALKESEGDLIIFDPTSGDSMTNIVNNLGLKATKQIRRDPNDAVPIFSVSKRTRSQEKQSLKIDDVLQLEYEHIMGHYSEEDFDRLYAEIGNMISEEIKNKKAEFSDDSKDEASSPKKDHVVHVTVLTPFSNLSDATGILNPEQKRMALDAFARGTSKWLEKNPSLRIQVHGSRVVSIPDIKGAYQSNLNKSD
jgi:hypothetical protein